MTARWFAAALLLGTGCAALPRGTSLSGNVVLRDPDGKERPLQDVFVYVKEGAPPGPYPVPTDPVVLDQKSYQFHPRVLGLRVGQTLRVTSQDPTLHNVNCTPFQNRGFNDSLYAGESRERVFTAPEVVVPIHCDLHPGMKAFVGVLEHPFFRVTGDDGAFRFDALPYGEYTIETWAEDRGTRRARGRPGAAFKLVYE